VWYDLNTESLAALNTAVDGNALSEANGDDVSLLQRKTNGFDMNIGALIRVYKQVLIVGVVGENLLQLDELLAPRAVGAGASIRIKSTFNINYDMRFAFANDQRQFAMSYRGGIEAFLQSMYALRAGAFHDTRQDATYMTFGIGIYNPRVGIEGAFAQQLGGVGDRMFSIGLQVYMP